MNRPKCDAPYGHKKATSFEVAFFVLQLPHQDSNLEKRYQKPVCYHYTMGQLRLGRAKINKEK